MGIGIHLGFITVIENAQQKYTRRNFTLVKGSPSQEVPR